MSHAVKNSHHFLYFELGKLEDIFEMCDGLFKSLPLGPWELDGLEGAHGWCRIDDKHSNCVLVVCVLEGVKGVRDGLTPARSAAMVV